MKNYRLLSLLFFLFGFSLSLPAQTDYIFRHLDVNLGFPENQILSVFYLPDGRLGIRTTASLTFYDGGKCDNYVYTPHSVYNWDYSGACCECIDGNGLIWMKNVGTLSVFNLHSLSYINNVDSLFRAMHVTEPVSDLYVDNKQRFWIVTDSQRVLYYTPKTDRIVEVCAPANNNRKNGQICYVAESNNLCRIVYSNGLIRCWDVKQERFVQREDFFIPYMKHRYNDVFIVKPMANGDTWLISNQCVAYFDAMEQQWTLVPQLDIPSNDMFCALDVDSLGNAWVGTSRSGLFVINRKNLSFRKYKTIPLLNGSSIENDVISIAISPHGGSVWLGLYNKGLCYYHPSLNKFSQINSSIISRMPGNEIWKDDNIRSLLAMPDQTVWVGTQHGLYCYNPETQQVTIPFPRLGDVLCRRLYRDSKGRVWIGTFQEGLYCIEGKNIKSYKQPKLSLRSDYEYNNIRNIFEDKEGNLWVSVYGGLCLFHPESGKFDLLNLRHPELNRFKKSLIVNQTPEGYLVVGSSNGIYCYDPHTDRVWIPANAIDPDPCFEHSNDNYTCIFPDTRGLMWFGTYNGLNVVDFERRRVYQLNEKQGMFNHVVKNVVEDDNNDMWVSTSNGLCKVDVEERGDGTYGFNIISFNSGDGLQGGEYFDMCGCKTNNGVIYFGGVNGFDMFQPDNIVYNTYAAQPIFTGFRLFNTEIKPGDMYKGRVIMDKSIGYVKEIDLKYDENFFTISFSALNFVNPSKTYYQYKLEGFDKDWIELASIRGSGVATYNNLAPGTYVFNVRSANNDKVWNDQEAELLITIAPPFWNTLLARIFYALVLVGMLTGAYIYLRRLSRVKLQKAKEQEAIRQKEELEQMKYRFFTNISHEFRTPLTLIITPLDAIIKKLTDENLKKQLSSVYKNAQQMLGLVNQLLDFRKLEMKGEKLNLQAGFVTDFILPLYSSFQSLAEEKHIDYIYEPCEEQVYMYFDGEKLQKIVNNLLSNAFKFTPNGGSISLRDGRVVEENRSYFFIEVSDSGVGISEEDQKHIFDRFYQVKTANKSEAGSGIGLHLIREYVNLHNGKIRVDSKQGEGSTFCVYIPMDLKVEEVSEEVSKPAKETYREDNPEENLQEKPVRQTVLVVEDNHEFRSFLIEQLSEDFRVIDAADGEEGLQKAIQLGADLIVSDVMMPKMDGFELCKRIKENIQTSHIPIILLSARSTEEVKISGYEAGADSYIAKPFSIDLLLTRIRKLIEQQQKRRESFNKNLEVEPSNITITSIDEQLIKRALECVEKNMNNCEYTVEQLSSDVGMTRMNLYRKLQNITGQTPTEFIRSIRLKRAAQLLQGSQLTILQISDLVGYNSSRAFSKNFKEMFGMLPSQYAELHNGQKKEQKEK